MFLFNNNTHEQLVALNEVNSTIPGKIEYYSVNTSLSPFVSCNSTSNGKEKKWAYVDYGFSKRNESSTSYARLRCYEELCFTVISGFECHLVDFLYH